MILRLVFALVLPVLTTACVGQSLPAASGPIRQLNVGHWMPDPNELTTPAAVPVGAGT